MSTIEIIEVKKDTIVKTGERFLDVHAVIVDGKKKLPRNYGFPLDTPKKVIEKELKKALELYEEEKATAEAQAEVQATDEGADKTIESLEGTKFTSN